MITVMIGSEVKELKRKKISVEALLRRLCINPETALVLRRGALLTEDELLTDGDSCTILRTVPER